MAVLAQISRAIVVFATLGAVTALLSITALASPKQATAAVRTARLSPSSTTKVPSALELYRSYLNSDDRYAYSARKFTTTWRDDGLAFASATLINNLPPSYDSIAYTAPASRKGRVILDDRATHQQWTYVPGHNLLIHSYSRQDPTAPRQSDLFQLLVSNYEFKVQPKPVVIAGRKAFAVVLQPRVAGQPYEKLWIDPYTGVMLRREAYHADGSISSVSYLSEIHFHPELSQSDFSSKRWDVKKPRIYNEPRQTETLLDPSKLPAPFAGRAIVPQTLQGYALQEITLLHNGPGVALHVLYTDGLFQFSLYETPRRGHSPTRLPSSRDIAIAPGLTAHVAHKYSYSILSWDGPGLNYTLLADLSVRTLLQVAEATGTVDAPVAAQVQTAHGRR